MYRLKINYVVNMDVIHIVSTGILYFSFISLLPRWCRVTWGSSRDWRLWRIVWIWIQGLTWLALMDVRYYMENRENGVSGLTWGMERYSMECGFNWETWTVIVTRTDNRYLFWKLEKVHGYLTKWWLEIEWTIIW